MRRPLATFTMLLALLATGAQVAHASGKAVLDDCTDDERMSKTYSQADYRSALGQLAADTDQYGNCRDVIRRAMLAAASAKKRTTKDKQGTPGAGDRSGVVGSEPAETQLGTATPAERSEIDKARTTPTITAPTVDPTTAGTAPTASQGTSLPTPLIVLLGLLGAGLLALAAVKIKSLVNARRG